MKNFKKRMAAIALAVMMTAAMMATSASAATYVVAKGDTLWGIAKEHLGSGTKWTELYEANKDLISDPNLIYVGQEFVIPGTETPELEPIEVNVTLSDKGSLVMTKETVTVTDVDGDGAYTVNDMLYAAHDAAYEGGSAAGYATAETQWGLSISKLWGDDSGNFGYWLNNASCWSLTDPVAEGDYLVAFVYYDGVTYSDAYSYFTEDGYTAAAGEALTVDLQAVCGYDENWNRLFDGYTGATLTVVGGECAVVDNGDGTYAVTVSEAGTYYLVATAENNAIVPAVADLVVE